MVKSLLFDVLAKILAAGFLAIFLLHKVRRSPETRYGFQDRVRNVAKKVLKNSPNIFAIASFAMLLPIALWAQDVQVVAEVEAGRIVAGEVVDGTITITHDEGLSVDPSSIKLGDDPLKAEFVKQVKLSPSSPLVLSIYSFQLEGRPAGTYPLPSVSVDVGGGTYKSFPSSYLIVEGAPISTPKRVPAPRVNPVLKLDLSIDGEQPFYPGQRFRVIYRYFFNTSIQLSKEDLPLLEPERGFRKIGSQEIRSYDTGNWSVQEVSQELEAIADGDFVFGKSTVEGSAYGMQVRAETPITHIQVAPLPKEGRPTCFNGAIGRFTFDVSMLTPSKVKVGDKVTLQVDISGKGNIDEARLPDLACQPGFSGMFRFKDLPPTADLKGGVKRFHVELRPLQPAITEVPKIAFSFFNPRDHIYTTLYSQPIPLAVADVDIEPLIPKKKASKPIVKQDTVTQEEPYLPDAIEIQGNEKLAYADVRSLPFGTWWVIFLIPIGVIVIQLQRSLRQYLIEKRQADTAETAEEVFFKAVRKGDFPNISHAFLLRLVERGEIDSADISPANLPEGEVRQLLLTIEEKRFGGKKGVHDQALIESAKKLFR